MVQWLTGKRGRGYKKSIIMDINIILTESFEGWMKTLEYAPSTVYASVRYVKDFFLYLKNS